MIKLNESQLISINFALENTPYKCKHRDGICIISKDGDTLTKKEEKELLGILDTFDPLPDLKRICKEKIVNQINECSSSESLYPEIEKKRFEAQEREYFAWLLDVKSPTPNVDSIAKTRGIDRVELLDKIGNKVIKHNEVGNYIIGERQKLFDKINSTSDVTEFANINFEM